MANKKEIQSFCEKNLKTNKMYTRKELINLLKTKYPDGSDFLPSDYCYNRFQKLNSNGDISYENTPKCFVYMGNAVYFYIGFKVGFTGPAINQNGEVKGYWTNGDFTFVSDDINE